MNVPLTYAYKVEGKDIDDGIENYEAEEMALADEALMQLEARMEESDFSPALVATSTNIRGQSNLARNSKESATKNTKVQESLMKIIRENQKYTDLGFRKEKNRAILLRLKLSMYSHILLGYIQEGREYEDHPLFYSINEILERLSVGEENLHNSHVVSSKTDHLAESLDNTQESSRRMATEEIVTNKGLTRLRPKDRKNPRLAQRRRFKIGMKKVKSTTKSYKPEGKGGFSGVKAIRPHIVRSQDLL
mmetsp:Transcript_24264/g.37822  ORF Transcript_24264/g.37822 Transcript_24264/m.37822 type:complete len:248 (-) Transcript_24264:109-852(-)